MSNPHSEHGMPARKPTPGHDSSWWNTALVVLCVLLSYLVAMQFDQIDELEQQLIQEQLDDAAHMGVIEREVTDKIAQAYAQGQRDAVASLNSKAALQVAQLCQAWRYQLQAAEPDAVVARSYEIGG